MNKQLFGLLGLGLTLLLVIFFLQSQDGNVQVDNSAAKGADPQINWIWNDLNKGVQVAKEVDKPVLINFWAEWCSWCVKMDKEVMSDGEVIDFVSENFVPVKIDSDLPENRRLLMLYRITGHPSFVILDKNGKFLGKAVGYMPKDIFLQVLEAYVTEN
jgi:thioredoxin-related protein